LEETLGRNLKFRKIKLQISKVSNTLFPWFGLDPRATWFKNGPLDVKTKSGK